MRMTHSLNTANAITFFRFLLASIFLLLAGNHPLLGLLILIVAAFSDWLDGYIARKYQMQTDLGAFLDPLADKCMSLACLIVINVNFLSIPMALASSLIVMRDIRMTHLRIQERRKNSPSQLGVSQLGKQKTALLFLSQILLIFYQYAESELVYQLGSVLLYVSSLLTLISFWQYTTVKKG